MGPSGSNLADLEREAEYRIKVITKPKGKGKGDKGDQRDNFVVVQGLPEDVERWAAILLERYRGRKIKPKVVYRSTILIMTAMTIAAVVNSMVITNILHIKAALGCPRYLEPPGDIEEARGGPEFVFTPLFDSLFQFYFPPTVWPP